MLVRQRLGPAIVGLNPLDTTLVHDRLARLRPPRSTLGALDIALWDLKGKLLGLPIYRLLGGARRDRVPAYASLHNYSESADLAEELRELVRDARRQGYRGLKLKIGGRPLPEDLRYVAVAREAAGDDFDLMADANQTYEMADAVRVGRALGDLRYAWFEEPLDHRDLAGYAELRAKLDLPIAGGEGATSPSDIVQILQHRAVDITQPDVAGVGGITEAQHLPTLARHWGAAPTWHVWNSPIIQVATLHVLASQEPWRAYSMLPGAAPLEITTMPNPLRDRVLIGAPRIQPDGTIPLPSGPGLGVDVDVAALEEFALNG
jgi:D-galactarolactone cycloisomerase